jgi:hypothetical protein
VRLDIGYSHIFVFDRVVGNESIVTAGNVEVPPPVAAEGELRTRIAMGRYRAGYDMLNVAVTVAFDDLFDFGVHTPKAAPLPPALPVDVAPTEAPIDTPATPDTPAAETPPAPPAPDATT